MNTLKNLLHEKINGKKYLLVLDDVWNDDFQKWFGLKDLLAGGARGSKIIITTRVKKVAEMMGTVSAYELQGLSEADSWFLFTQMAFKQGQVPTPSHETIGQEIVAKCMGVPLAIKTIGRLLYSKDTLSEWESFKNKELSRIDQQESDIMPTLKLSYNHLPSHLKHCFAYCRLFPKDYKIDIETLVNLWVAEGYIRSSDPNQCLEDIGYECYKDLVWRSFLQEDKLDIWGSRLTCKMHDLIHDLAELVAGEESTLLNSSVQHVDQRTRYVSLNFDLDSLGQVLPPLVKAKKLRTFLLLDESGCKIEEGQCHSIFSGLRSLRVLDLHRMAILTVPQSIGKLKHLRYLDLSNNSFIEMLPDSITRLQNLQVLKLDWCYRLKQLPKNIKNLVNLFHLFIYGCDSLTHMPPGLGQLTSLQKLSKFVLAKDNKSVSMHWGGLGELHGLNSLRGELGIQNLGYVKTADELKAANLKEKKYLGSLRLVWNGNDDYATDVENDEMVFEVLEPPLNLQGLLVDWYGGIQFPSWLSTLTKLEAIAFCDCKKCQNLPPLHQFPRLKFFSIERLTDLEYIDSEVNSDNVGGDSVLFFPSLEHIKLNDCPNLKGWWRTTPSWWPSIISPVFSQLKRLEIMRMKNLEFLPQELLQNLTSLKILNIFNCQSIRTLSQAVPHLNSLETLNVGGCEDLNFPNDDNDSGEQWQGLKRLHDLCIRSIPNLASLPPVFRHVTTLYRLTIIDCPNLMSLPEWMSDLTAMQYLSVERCPQLLERCRSNMGEDWPKICHVPSIEIEKQRVQWNGCYYL